VKIGVYIAGWKCPKMAQECMRSLSAQTFKDWKAIVWVDGADVETFNAIGQTSDIDGTIFLCESRQHSVALKVAAIEKLIEDGCEILVGLDLDDALDSNALQIIHDAHRLGAWATYGNWRNQTGMVSTEFKPWTPERFERIRELGWFTTAPQSFRAALWPHIPRSFFEWDDGSGLYPTGFDGSLFYPVVDLCGPDRVASIDATIYHYNRNRPESVLQAWTREHRRKVFAEQRGKPRLDRLERLEPLLAGAATGRKEQAWT